MKRSSARTAALASSPAGPEPGGSRGAAQDTRPWWRYGIVWLVIGGPATVVVAGIVTTVIAYSGADPVLDGASRAQSRVVPARASQAADLRTERTPDGPRTGAAGNRPDTPALQARNHAATPPASSGPSR